MVRPMLGSFGLATVLVTLTTASLEGQERALEVLSGASERYASVETLCANFEQKLEVTLLGREIVGNGRLCQGRPNLFGMRWSDPSGDLVVVDGTHAWVYFPSTDPMTVLRTGAERSAGGQDYHREFLVDPSSKYEIEYAESEEIDGHRVHRLIMRPLRPMSYHTATVWIDANDSVLRRIRLEEENGNVRTVTLTDVVFGATPGSGWFAFTPPDGAVVMAR